MHLSAGRKPLPTAASAAKRPVKLNMPGSAEFGGHFYIDGAATLPLASRANTRSSSKPAPST